MIPFSPIFATAVPTEGMTQKPVVLCQWGPFQLNNSMVAEGLACLLVVMIFYIKQLFKIGDAE